ncbi:MAG: hypothetical protein LKJ21_00350 [Oscillospiraceae bacterium]|jgi:hypothetical protein|nr:hypothetical protein [Oscillospiraceae bacterium]MCI1989860.1 hypothetical protein [Oscillospiraceae bacterium]MCI2034915.1 hypothetical protein [Oscillospiraceae bacterium]
MEIEKIASAVGSDQSVAGAAQPSGASDSQIAELRRLADSIRKMENDVRITARVQGMSGSGLQAKLRQYDDLLGKVNQQIRQLERQNRQSSVKEGGLPPKRVGVSMLQYHTDAAQIALRNSGVPLSAAVSDTMRVQISKAQANAAERKAEQKLKAQVQNEPEKTEASEVLNLLVWACPSGKSPHGLP